MQIAAVILGSWRYVTQTGIADSLYSKFQSNPTNIMKSWVRALTKLNFGGFKSALGIGSGYNFFIRATIWQE